MPRVRRNRIDQRHDHGEGLDQRHRRRELGAAGGEGVDDRRRDHLGVGAHQEHRGAELAHAGHEDQQPGRQDAGLEQRQGHGAHLVDPARAADAGALLQALVDLQHDAGQRAHAERQHDREIGQRQQPQRAVDRDRDVEPGPQQRQAEDQARHGLREHHQVLDRAAAPELRAVDDPDQDHHHQHADSSPRRSPASGCCPWRCAPGRATARSGSWRG